MKNEFIEKYSKDIQGVLSCYDRVIIRGTLPQVCHSSAMSNLLYNKGILLKDITQFTNPLRNQLHDNAKSIATRLGQEIEHIRKTKEVRKEDLVKQKLQKRPVSQGLVCILSAMESCSTYRMNFNQKSGLPQLYATKGRCLHYYFYFMDTAYGLCYMRVPTWCPFQLQFYFNAHNWLARQLDKEQISYQLRENAFTYIEDYERAQQIADGFSVAPLRDRLDYYAELCCPVAQQINHTGYHWSIRQLEYASDITFKDKNTLGPLFDELLKRMMHSVRPDDVARFLGRKEVHPNNKQDLATSYKHYPRQEIRRIKHWMGDSSLKMYDKFGQILRVETTNYNTYEFYHYRSVEHRDGTKSSRLAPVKKTIYSLKPLMGIMRGCNKRYLSYIATFEPPLKGKKRLNKVSKNTKVHNRSYKGLNFFDERDEQLLKIVAMGEFVLRGFRNKDLRKHLKDKSTGQVSRIIKRLRVLGLIKKVGKTYKYYLTSLGRKVIVTALNVKELFLVPQLNY